MADIPALLVPFLDPLPDTVLLGGCPLRRNSHIAKLE